MEHYVEADLNSLGIEYETDKSSNHHNYLYFYENFLIHFRDQKFSLMEFGCSLGKSLDMWAEYFPNAKIIGLDNHTDKITVQHNNIDIIQCDTSDPEQLIPILDTHCPFIIIDDASHKWTHQILGFEYSFHYLKNGGFYFCEDLHTSFGSYREEAYNDYYIDASQYFIQLALLKLGRGSVQHPLLANVPAPLLKIAPYVDYIAFRDHLTLIKKGA